jgi:hypothetical protein
MNHAFQYQRLILAYHGCDRKVADEVLLQGGQLRKSEKTYDWLGSGIYFWEHGPERALEWAENHRKIDTPAVVGAVIHLGNCFDLLDRRATQLLTDAFQDFEKEYLNQNIEIPKNRQLTTSDSESLLRQLDCSMINWLLEALESSSPSPSYDSVRGLFQEGEPVYEGSAIKRKSHIQIAIRNPSCILGYFKPS